MAQLNWSEPARRDLEEIIRYYESLSHKTALFYSEEILNAGDRLMLMPEMGPKEPLLKHYKRNYRYVLVQCRYKLIYFYEKETCSILMVWDYRQNSKRLKKSDRFKS